MYNNHFRVISAIVLLSLIASCSAQASWYVEEVWKGTPADTCSTKAANGLVTYTAYRSGICGSVDGSYRKYTCGADSATVQVCSNAACSTGCTTSTVSFATCRSFNGSQTVFNARCGALPSGTQGLATIEYADVDCKESFSRVFTLDNVCEAAEVSSNNRTVTNSVKLSCDGTRSIVINSCPGNGNCASCTATNVDQNKCNGSSKYVCGASDTAAASMIQLGLAIFLLAPIAMLLL